MSKQKNIKRQSGLPNKSKNQQPILVAEQHQRSGPLPAPIDFAKYNEVVPGAGERIISMAESRAKHHENLQIKQHFSHSSEIKRGQVMAFILGIVGLLCATYLGATGHGFVAMGLALAGISSMMSQLIWKRKK